MVVSSTVAVAMPTVYDVKLRPEPSDVPAEIRLRKFLKAASRSYGLKCIDVREHSEASETIETTCNSEASESFGNTKGRADGENAPPCEPRAARGIVKGTTA